MEARARSDSNVPDNLLGSASEAKLSERKRGRVIPLALSHHWMLLSLLLMLLPSLFPRLGEMDAGDANAGMAGGIGGMFWRLLVGTVAMLAFRGGTKRWETK